MANDSSRPEKKKQDTAGEIFRQKIEFHRRQAGLPIEEKVRILVELQKIALTVQPKKQQNDSRMVWRIS